MIDSEILIALVVLAVSVGWLVGLAVAMLKERWEMR